MVQGDASGMLMIQHNVSDPGKILMSRDSDRGQEECFGQLHVNGDKAFDAALHKQLRIALEQFRIMAVDDGEKEIIFLTEILFDAADHKRTVGISDFLGDEDRKS